MPNNTETLNNFIDVLAGLAKSAVANLEPVAQPTEPVPVNNKPLRVGAIVLPAVKGAERIVGIVTEKARDGVVEVTWVSDHRGVFVNDEAVADVRRAPLHLRDRDDPSERFLVHKDVARAIGDARDLADLPFD